MLAEQGFKKPGPFVGDVFDNQYFSAHRLLLNDENIEWEGVILKVIRFLSTLRFMRVP